MNNNSKLQKSSSIFIAAVLVAGVIAIASPSIAFAEESDRYDKKYDSYEQDRKDKKYSYDPYKEDKKYSYDPYKEDKKYSYDSYKEDKKYSYDPYKEDKKDGKPGWNQHKAACKVGNIYVNTFEQFQGSFETELANLASEAASAETPEEFSGPNGGMNAPNGGMTGNSNGGGDPVFNVEGNVLNVCANFLNDNEPRVVDADQNQRD
jgi:hypothetical protein